MKNAIAKKSDTQFIEIVRPGDQLDAAGRVNYFHNLSKQAGEVSIRAALYAGMELFRAKIDHAGTFDAWIEQNCEFSRRTAFKYLALVQRSIGAQTDLLQLAETTDKKREEAIEEYSSRVESKNMTELMCDYGIITKSKSNLGGKREGAGRKRKDASEDLARAAEEAANGGELAKTIVNEAVSNLYRIAIVEGTIGNLETPDLKAVVETLKQILATAEKIVKSRRN